MYEDWLVATDDSVWQGPTVNYAAAASAGVRMTWHRAGYGDDRHPQARRYQFGKDSAYEMHRRQAAGHVQRGAYIFPIPAASSVRATAEAFFRYVGGDWMELAPMVDMENPPNSSQVAQLGVNGLLDWILAFGQAIARESGRKPIAYGGAYPSSYGLPSDPALAKIYDGQWLAYYPDYEHTHGPNWRPNFAPPTHPAWAQLLIWQHTGGNGRCPGYQGAVDLDLVHPMFATTTISAPIEVEEPAPTPPVPAPTEDDDVITYKVGLDEGARALYRVEFVNGIPNHKTWIASTDHADYWLNADVGPHLEWLGPYAGVLNMLPTIGDLPGGRTLTDADIQAITGHLPVSAP